MFPIRRKSSNPTKINNKNTTTYTTETSHHSIISPLQQHTALS